MIERRPCLIAILLFVAAGCGDSDAEGTSAADGGTTNDASGQDGAVAPDGGEPSNEACVDGWLEAGDYEFALTHAGVEYGYRLHVPTDYAGTAAPLVVNFHGFTSNAAEQQIFSAMNPDADARGIVVAYPNGPNASWNGGTCCGQAAMDDRDDVGFVRAMVAEIERTLCIDATRIYATGMSNGGFLSHRLACEAADLFAAVAPVDGVIGVATCTPERPISVIHFHGTEDTLVPYEGNRVFDSVPATLEAWADRNGCTGEPVETFANGAATCSSWTSCDAEVEVTLCTIVGMGHCWPGQSICPFGGTTNDISANVAMFDFFERFTLE